MKTIYLRNLLIAFCFTSPFLILSCSDDETSKEPQTSNPSLNVDGEITDFGEVSIGYTGEQQISIKTESIIGITSINTSGNYKISINGETFHNELELTEENMVAEQNLYIQFAPTEEGEDTGSLAITNANIDNININLKGTGVRTVNTYQAFENEHLAFGDNNNQASEQSFTLQEDVSRTKNIMMYIRLNCPSGGCDAWDRFAHVQVKDPSSGLWYEMGRYITPYGVDNHQLERGFSIDVTDFKSLLRGDVELRIYAETWVNPGWSVSLEFDYTEGYPDYKYYNIARVIEYNKNSLNGVPYGVDYDENEFDLTKTINFPDNTEATHLRSIISGWGHETPADTGNRRCAEWCFRTHHVHINGAETFAHNMEAIGCNQNQVSPQAGNWQPDRAGWCPGMEVPVRINEFESSMEGESIEFEYKFEPWVSNETADGAFYAISTFVVVKSNTEISKPIVN